MTEETFDYSELEAGLVLSRAPRGAADILGLGVEGVVNLCDFDDALYVRELPESMAYRRVPFEDMVPVPRPFLLRAVLELAALRKRGQPALVHCRSGASRSVSVVLLYWMARDSVPWQEALARLRSRRARSDPHPMLVDPAGREAVVEAVRGFLAGDEERLACSRQEEQELRLIPTTLPASCLLAGRYHLLEPGLILGPAPRTPGDLVELGCARILGLDHFAPRPPSWARELPTGVEYEALGLAPDQAVDPSKARRALELLRAWREQGHTVLVQSSDGRSRAALVACLDLMVRHGWDFASALWFLRERFPEAYPSPALFAGRDLEELARGP